MFIRKLLGLILLACLLSGCFSPAKIPATTKYNLSAVPEQFSVKKPRGSAASITVSKPTASEPYNSRDMVYRQGLVTGAFNYHSWDASIPDILQNQMLEALIRSHLFKAVVSGQSYTNTRYSLRTQVLNFEQVFYMDDSAFVLKINATIVENKTNRIVAQKLFNIVEAAPSNNPQGGVIAANTAMEQYLLQLVAFVSRY